MVAHLVPLTLSKRARGSWADNRGIKVLGIKNIVDFGRSAGRKRMHSRLRTPAIIDAAPPVGAGTGDLKRRTPRRPLELSCTHLVSFPACRGSSSGVAGVAQLTIGLITTLLISINLVDGEGSRQWW